MGLKEYNLMQVRLFDLMGLTGTEANFISICTIISKYRELSEEEAERAIKEELKILWINKIKSLFN